MSLRFGTLGHALPPSGTPLLRGKLTIVRSVRWSRGGFELVCREARARGEDPAAYVRKAAIRQAESDAEERRRMDPRNRRPPSWDGEE